MIEERVNYPSIDREVILLNHGHIKCQREDSQNMWGKMIKNLWQRIN